MNRQRSGFGLYAAFMVIIVLAMFYITGKISAGSSPSQQKFETAVKDGKVTDELVYLDASQEIGEVIADAGEALNEDGTFRDERVNARSNMQPSQVDASQVTFMDAAHRQILGSTAALVPFIEKTRVDRALTGSNMQRQAVPLLCPESATVGTGIEKAVAENSGHFI